MPGPIYNSMKELLRAVLKEDRQLLRDRDTLIARLSDQTTGEMMRDFASLRTALQKNVGERFLSADGSATEEEQTVVCDEVRQQLIRDGMQKKRADSVVEAFAYALQWEDEESQGEDASYAAFGDDSPDDSQRPEASAREWTCACGNVNDGNFCIECGRLRPEMGTQSNQTDEGHDISSTETAPVPKSIPLSLEAVTQTDKTEIPQGPKEVVITTISEDASKKKVAMIAAGLLVLGGMMYSFSTSKTPSPASSGVVQSQAEPKTEKQPAPRVEQRLPVTAESTLGGLKIGDTEEKMRQLWGQETQKRPGEMNLFYNYRYEKMASVSACSRETVKKVDYIFRISTGNGASSLQTDRGIHIGSTVQEMLKVYDDSYIKTEEPANNRVKYLYTFAAPIGAEPGKLLFIAALDSHRITDIELSMPRRNIPMAKDFKGEGEILKEKALDVLTLYHQAITRRDYNTAYGMLSPEEQDAHGTLAAYSGGYANTISSEIIDARAESFRGEAEWKIYYRLKARDHEGNRIKVQFFEGVAHIKLSGRSGKIISMQSRKTGETYE